MATCRAPALRASSDKTRSKVLGQGVQFIATNRIEALKPGSGKSWRKSLAGIPRAQPTPGPGEG